MQMAKLYILGVSHVPLETLAVPDAPLDSWGAALMQSVRRYQLPLENLLSPNYPQIAFTGQPFVELCRQRCAALDPEDLVLACDLFDIFFCCGPVEIMEKFYGMRIPVVLSGE